MKKHVKIYEEFVNEIAYNQNPISIQHPGVGMPSMSRGADSEDEIIPLAQQDPVLQFGVWAQSATGVQPNGEYPDILLAQARLHGMSPEEYLAHYGRDTEGHDK